MLQQNPAPVLAGRLCFQALQLAAALREEVAALEAAGCKVIQVCVAVAVAVLN